VLNLPNLITLLRVAVVPVFLILLTAERYTEALVLFILAAATDSLDGAIARLTNTRTTFGAYIDPLADKLLLMSSFIVLAFLRLVPLWLTLLVVSRDMIILMGFVRLFFITEHFIAVPPPGLPGKACTFLQLLTVTLTLLSLHDPVWHLPLLWYGAILLAGGTTILSGFQYLYRFQRLYRKQMGLDEHETQEGFSIDSGKANQEKEEKRQYSVRGG
jgi:cardiolipin synthase